MSASSDNRNWTLTPLARSPGGPTTGTPLGRATSPRRLFGTQSEVSPVSLNQARPWLHHWHQQQYRDAWQQSWQKQRGESPQQPQQQPQSQSHLSPSPPHAAEPSSTPASPPSPHQHHHHQLGQRAPSIIPFASSFLSFASSLLSPPPPLPPISLLESSLSSSSSSTPNLEPTSINALTTRRRHRFAASSNYHQNRVPEPGSLVSDGAHHIAPVRRRHRHEATFTLTTTTGTTHHNPFEFLQTYNAPFALSSTFVGFPHQRASLFHWSVRLAAPGAVFEASIISDPETARHDVAICLRQQALPSPAPRISFEDRQTLQFPEQRLLDYDKPLLSPPSPTNDTLSRCTEDQDHVFRCQRLTEQINSAVNTSHLTPPPTPTPIRTMNDTPQLLRPTRQLSSHSPTRHRYTASVSDDFIAQLAPQSAVDALTSATGSLRACLDGASASERDFTMRTAVASKMIWGWVQELSSWSWPSGGGSAGFEAPDTRQREPDIRVTSPPEEKEQEYMGSLAADDVALYEARIETIQREMMELEVEDIKSHVMSQHILPLSRPSTPMSGSSRSSMFTSVSSYNKMEDLSAAVTAIVINTLPNLAKLSRLMQTWSIRLRVLHQVPRLLLAIKDAEVALLSGWNAITAPAKMAQQQVAGNSQTASLSREHFNVMKAVIETKVVMSGRTADYMLDCLEGEPDTLPDEWLDRLERVEQDYVEWVAACERKMQETEWAQTWKSSDETSERMSAVAKSNPADGGIHRNNLQQLQDEKRSSPEAALSASETAGTTNKQDTNDTPTPPVAESLEEAGQGGERKADSALDIPDALEPDEGRVVLGLDGASSDLTAPSLGPALPILAVAFTDTKPQLRATDKDTPLDEDSAYPDLDDEMDLPPLRSDSRRNSDASESSTVLHGASSHFDGSDMPEISASPDIARTQIREAEYVGTSPPSSPPLPQEDEPEKKVKPADISVIETVPEEDEEDFPRTPLDASFVDDYDDSFSVSEAAAGSPSKRRESSSDIQLRQQISQIIESIPAKIKLTSETPNVNLNPPDLQLPKIRKKPSIDRFKRSGSALSTVSSRSGTPAFTLSPAKNARPSRAQRGQQEIKVYHLSRSTGEAPIKLFIRCVGENGERVMVRVGGGWADLSEYLKEYASHHKRRSAAADGPKVEVRDVPRVASGRTTAIGSSPPSRPGSALDSPLTPLNVRKPRRSSGAFGNEAPRLLPWTPASAGADDSLSDIPQSEDSMRSRSSSRVGWVEDESSFLGLAGPSGKRVEMSEENKAWVESVKEKVRLASGELRAPPFSTGGTASDDLNNHNRRFGELGKVGGTKRLFRKSEDARRK